MDIIEKVDVKRFKEYFVYDFNYLKIYNTETTYNINDIVFDNNLFYISLKNGNINNSLDNTEFWQEIQENIKNYITDNIIEKAIFQAKNFIITQIHLFRLPAEKDLFEMLYLYLIAYFVCFDFTAQNGTSKGTNGIVASKSVDGVSVSYNTEMPEIIKNNIFLKDLYNNQYGEKYLFYILPRLKGNTFKVVKGTTTSD